MWTTRGGRQYRGTGGPRKRASGAGPRGDTPAGRGGAGMAGGRRALVAEDEALIAMDVEAALRRAGWEVVGPVSRAADAARLAAREPLDAAVLDIGLGGG